MLEFKIAATNEELLLFGTLKMELMQYHKNYAESFGIHDMELEEYTLERALNNAEQRDSYLIYRNHRLAGMVQVSEVISDVDQTEILFVHSLYLKELYRNCGIGGLLLRYLCRKYKKRIECECWYDLPAGRVYQRAGFRSMMTRFVLPLNSPFYGSDQY